MSCVSRLMSVAALAASALAISVPSLDVPQCPRTAQISYDKSVPDLKPFPTTKVNICYDEQNIRIRFTALNETNFYYNKTLGTNDPIYNYETMEAFIYQGTKDPSQYFEFEVAPNNVTFNGFIYNPSKTRAPGAPYSGGLLINPIEDGLVAHTVLNRTAHTWISDVRLPLPLFNVDPGQGKGTKWRMNFFRIVESAKTTPNQFLGAWSPPNEPNFHNTPYFGHVNFV